MTHVQAGCIYAFLVSDMLELTLEFFDFGLGDVGINNVEEISEFFTIPKFGITSASER